MSIYYDNNRFGFWSRIVIKRSIDNIDTVELDAPFDPADPVHRATFRPFTYLPVSVDVNDEPIFTGTCPGPAPTLENTKSTISLGSYSLPGVLGECTTQSVDLPSKFENQNLHEIASTLVNPFGLQVEARVDPGNVFKKVRSEPENKILEFLADLAKQRNQLISTNEIGDLVFQRAESDGDPVARLVQGLSPMLSVSSTFNQSEYYSEITGLKPIRVRAKKKNKLTLENTLLVGVIRPFIFQAPDTKDVDLIESVKGTVGRMFANMVSYSVNVATWRDSSDRLWAPNTFVELEAPGVMIYSPTKFLIRSVTLLQDAKQETARLDLILPGSFTEVQPGGLPWDG